MKTILAAVVSIGFFASAAMACPHQEGAEAKTVKNEKAEPKQADAKPAPKATPSTPAPVKKAAPKAATGAAAPTAGKVSSR